MHICVEEGGTGQGGNGSGEGPTLSRTAQQTQFALMHALDFWYIFSPTRSLVLLHSSTSIIIKPALVLCCVPQTHLSVFASILPVVLLPLPIMPTR